MCVMKEIAYICIVIISVQPVIWVWWKKKQTLVLLGHWNCDQCETLHDDSTLGALLVIFQGLNGVKQLKVVKLNQLLLDELQTFTNCLDCFTHCSSSFDAGLFSREIMDIAWLEQTPMYAFSSDSVEMRSFSPWM